MLGVWFESKYLEVIFEIDVEKHLNFRCWCVDIVDAIQPLADVLVELLTLLEHPMGLRTRPC